MLTTRGMLAGTSAAALLATVASADLVVDQNLGPQGFGSINLVGTTVGQPNNATFYPPITFDESLGEYVYELSFAQPTAVSMTNNEGIFVGADNDHFFLNSLSVDGGGNALGTVGFVDEEGAFGGFAAGTYYLSVDTFSGSFEGAYDITLNFSAITTPSGAINLGVVGNDTDPFDANTIASDFDTELGIYDSLGNLLGNNDDIGGGVLQSQLTAANLPAGTYYAAVSGWNTAFGGSFDVTPGSASGNLGFEVNGVTDSRPHAADTVTWYQFEIIPTPGTLALLSVGGLAAVRRRRH